MTALPPLFRDHPWRLRAAALALAALLVSGASLAPQVLRTVEEISGDAAWRLAVSSQPERRWWWSISTKPAWTSVGAWPWPRETVAALSRRIQEAGAAVQAVDIFFDASRPGDAELRAAWQAAPVVLGQVSHSTRDAAQSRHHRRRHPAAGRCVQGAAGAGCPPFAPASAGYIGNSSTLAGAGTLAGHLTPRFQADGVVRELPALVCHEGRAYPSLALAALWRAAQPESTGVPATQPDWVWRKGEGLLDPAYVLTSPSLPGVRCRWTKRAIFGCPTVWPVHRSHPSARRRCWRDRRHRACWPAPSPCWAAPPSASATSLRRRWLPSRAAWRCTRSCWQGCWTIAFPTRRAWPAWGKAWSCCWWLGCCGGGSAPARCSSQAVASGWGSAGRALCGVSAFAALIQADLWLPWAAPALFALLAATTLATAEHALARAQRERLSAHLGAYLPAPVAQRLMASEPSGSVQVQRRPVSVMVADIRNFSAFAQHRPPEETAALLHAFYCVAVDVVEQHGGIVEHIVGDSVLAVWNAYADCDDHFNERWMPAKCSCAKRAACWRGASGLTTATWCSRWRWGWAWNAVWRWSARLGLRAAVRMRRWVSQSA
jgi:adenylate cyclase